MHGRITHSSMCIFSFFGVCLLAVTLNCTCIVGVEGCFNFGRGKSLIFLHSFSKSWDVGRGKPRLHPHCVKTFLLSAPEDRTVSSPLYSCAHVWSTFTFVFFFKFDFPPLVSYTPVLSGCAGNWDFLLDAPLLCVGVSVLFLCNQLCTIFRLKLEAALPRGNTCCLLSVKNAGLHVYNMDTLYTAKHAAPFETPPLELLAPPPPPPSPSPPPSPMQPYSPDSFFCLPLLLLLPPHLFSSMPSSFKASEDGQVVSSSCVTTCLVSWCACSCQYLCLLWIACFSPWLDTNVAHKLLLTLMWTNVGDPEIKMIKGTK